MDRAGASSLAGGWRRVTAFGLLDSLLATQAQANAAAAVEDSRRLKLHRRLEESEMLLVCAAAVQQPAFGAGASRPGSPRAG